MHSPVKPARLLSLHATAWREIRQLLRTDGVRPLLGTRLAYEWRSRLYELAWRMRPDRSREHELAIGILVCGFWRSGTTLLHECISQDSRWRPPTTQECMNPGQPSLGSDGAQQRPMDNIVVRAESPQEDEFALLVLGAQSFYRTLLCPGAWRGLAQELAAGESAASWQQREKIFREFAAGLQTRDRRPLLLKSPTHSFALAHLLQAHSRACAIVVIRDWRWVWPSALRMWSEMFKLYALSSWTPSEVAELTAHTYALYAQSTLRQASALPKERVAAILYEDLVTHPVDTLHAAYQRIGLGWPEEATERVHEFVARTRPQPSPAPGNPVESSAQGATLEECYRSILTSFQPFIVRPQTIARE
jgi:omega-hydroxy-beta-dihydromenaquinone-9 sulfotransferase